MWRNEKTPALVKRAGVWTAMSAGPLTYAATRGRPSSSPFGELAVFDMRICIRGVAVIVRLVRWETKKPDGSAARLNAF